LTLIGKDKNLLKGSAFSEEVTDNKSMINYVLMLVSGRDGSNTEDSVLQETEKLIKDMFVMGEFRSVAEKYHINQHEIRKILYQVILMMNIPLISFNIALIMKPEDGNRDVYIGHGGMGICYKINSNEVTRLTPEEKNTPEITSEKLKKEDAFLMCSCEVADSLDNKYAQQTLNFYREPEELCKKLIFSSYNKTGVGNFSAAVFVERTKHVSGQKKKRIIRNVVIGIVILLLTTAGFFINEYISKTKEQEAIRGKIDSSPQTNTPPVSINETPHEVLIPDKSTKSTEDQVEEQAKKINNNRNVDFMVNGSVVMITNWNAVGKEIKYINWEPNQRSKKRIHKYSDFTQMPGSIRIIFKDNSTRDFSIKNN
jgi:hypothetical protein